MSLGRILERVAAGDLSSEKAHAELTEWGFVQVGHHKLDLGREERTALPEVVFGLSKSVAQLEEIFGWFVSRDLPVLATKVSPEKGRRIAAQFAEVEYLEEGALLMRGRSSRPSAGRVAVLAAGSSDVAVAEEAAGTLGFFGIETERSYDCGVAGIHRLLASTGMIAAADVLIVVAGMEGALPSVVAGLVRQPVIAVPTSVGYGASFGGIAALLGMLNSCAAGVSVVNIDNGFGAAMVAARILAGAR